MKPICSIGAIAYELGRPVPIAEWPELADLPAARKQLLDGGLRDLAVSELSPPELALRSMQRTLQLSGLPPEDIDLVLYASNVTDEPSYTGPALQRVLVEAGLTRAVSLGLSLAGCTNALAALQIAANAFAAGTRHVLIVSTDRVRPTNTRLLPEHPSILSDGAVSFLVEPAGVRELDVLAAACRAAPLLGGLKMNEPAFLVGTVNCAREVFRQLQRDTGLGPKDLCLVSANNFRRPITQTLLTYGGLPGVPIYEDNLARFAHCQAADAFIGLADAIQQDRIPVGGNAVVLTNTFFLWGAAIVHRRAA